MADYEKLKTKVNYIRSASVFEITPAILPIFGGYLFSQKLTPEVLQFGTSTVEVYEVTSQANLNVLIQEVGLPENIANKYKEYGNMYIYLVNLKSIPISSPLSLEIKSNCPKTYDSMIPHFKTPTQIEIQNQKYKYEIQNMFAELCQNECITLGKNCTYIQTINWIRGLSEELLNAEPKDIKGVKITWKVSLSEKSGEYYTWYPLGTGKLWENPIGTTKIYVFPRTYSVSKISPYLYQSLPFGENVYRVELKNTNPDKDLEVYVRLPSTLDRVWNSFSRTIKIIPFNLLKIVNSWVIYVFTFILFLISWMLAFKCISKFVLGKRFDIYKAIKESLLNFGVFILLWLGAITFLPPILSLIYIITFEISLGLVFFLPFIFGFFVYIFYNKLRYKIGWGRGFVFSLLTLLLSLVLYGLFLGFGYLIVLGSSAMIF